MKKVKKVGKLRMGGYAAGLPGGCFAISASSAILQSRASRTQWHFVPRDADFALALLEDNQAPRGRQSTDGGERSVTPGHVPLPPPTPSLAPSAQGGGVINLP